MNILLSYLNQLRSRIFQSGLIFLLIIVEVYFFVNGGAHFETWGETERQIVMAYIIMVVAFLIFKGRETEKEMTLDFPPAVVNFVLFFMGTYFIMASVTYLTGSEVTAMDQSLFWQTVVMQVAVVATSEELMFRGVLLEKFGIIVSSILFAGWHTYSYGIRYYDMSTLSLELLFPFVVALVMGLILAILVKQKRFGLETAIAIHASYNLYVSGAFVTFGMLS